MPDDGSANPDDGNTAPDDGSAPDDGATGPDNWAFQAPDDPSAGGDTNGGADGTEQPTAGRGSDRAGSGQGDGGDPNSPTEISRRLAGDDPAPEVGTGRTRHGGISQGLSWADPSAMAGETLNGTTTTVAPDPTPDAAAVSELPADFDESAQPAAPPTATDEALDAVALLQTGHTDQGATDKPALWATAIAFGALLLVSAAWLWTRRGNYDPA